ncbi:hypothetical protein SmJEL517_g03444 [Synchytrium microbalum]|uniref:Putative gamma-glutamylcyclotransferase n=1 Tax=Synchytrium microbalum TaxID=1806994 RepID=A0A507C849_9FUNG|nr:uncharacterized protein SmJEL517_g03444 [Synchytrium microbalum]TPX33703.1 hypothetical protein SmJEL517_g03444 [Synchytrium microbalum]
MTDKPVPLFFYGTLQSPLVYSRVISRHFGSAFTQPKMVPAVLKGYYRRRVKDAVYPAITASPDHQVEGHLAYVQTQKEVDILDVFEGEDYQRTPVKVTLSNNDIVDAHVYVWIAEKDYLEDLEWHLDQFEQQGAPKWVTDIDEFENVDAMRAATK